MSKALQVDPDIGLREILDISQSDQYSVQYSPFLQGPGGQLGGTIIRSASPLKGDTKNDGESFEEYRQRMQEKYEGTEMENVFEEDSGLDAARSMALEQKKTTGVAVIKQQGQYKIVSQASANLAVEGDTGATMVAQNLNSYAEAVDEYQKVSSVPLRRPRVA